LYNKLYKLRGIYMIRERYTGSDVTVLDAARTSGLGQLEFFHPAGTFALSPASHILIDAIAAHQNKLQGVGLDWGCGVGCLAILAAKISNVGTVLGLDISGKNIEAAAKNAAANGIADKTAFLLSDSYTPYASADSARLEGLRGRVDFILSNPPSSDGDDGFSYRRIVMDGAKDFLKKGGLVLLNVSLQYGPERLAALTRDGVFTYAELAASTDWVPFDLGRPELLECLKQYACEETKGGTPYAFRASIKNDAPSLSAREALVNYERYGISPLTKWQTHLFRYTG
jgi:methylase of polypeptide subunit release factors